MLLIESAALHPSMPDTNERRVNSALWWGLILTLLGLASNFLYFVTAAGNTIFPWLTEVVSLAGLVLLFIGIRRAFRQPHIFRGKILGSILTVVSALLFSLSTWGFFHARAVPASAGAPKVGEKAPDITLTNTSGQPVTLGQMLSLPLDASTGTRPKAVLLVFYRGYW